MISMARTFGAPDTVPAGKPGHQRIDRVVLRGQLADDIGHDVHDLAVIFEEEAVGDLAPCRSSATRPDIVAAEIEQHQMLGALLRVGEQLLGERLVLFRRRAARPRVRRSGGW